MLFIKYAPKFLRNLLGIVILILFSITLFQAVIDILDYPADKIYFVKVISIIYVGYIASNFLLVFAFKPIIKKYPKTYIVAYIIDVILLLCVMAIFNS